MNMQGFPRDFLLKLKPELEQARSAAVTPSTGVHPISGEAGFLTVSPRSTDESGVVETVICIKLNAHDVALIGSAKASAESYCEFDGKNRSAGQR